MPKKHSPTYERTVLLLQGGGALGAYQVGVFKGLVENNYSPNWIISTSIGAINSAIIAGNKPELRIKKLLEFWDTIATKLPPSPETLNNILMKRWENYLSAQMTIWFGQPGFFKPRWWNPLLSINSTTDKLSYYDTDELRDTLIKLVDFDYLNESKIRLSIGSVHIPTGHLLYFDNTKMRITPDHVMASSALPPGFPAINIEGEMFWDGGVHSNTQVNLLLADAEPKITLCFMVELFDSFGCVPKTMDDVLKRQKDINFSSHHRQFVRVYRSVHNLRRAIHILGRHLSENERKNPKVKKLLELGRDGIIRIVRFHYHGKHADLASKDYEFSSPSIETHITTGHKDVARALLDPPWLKPENEDLGLFLYEVTQYPVEDVDPYACS